MPVFQLTVHLISIIIGIIVLIFASIIAFKFRIKEAGYYAVIQMLLVVYFIIDLVYRRGEFFGWIITGKTPFWFENALYIFLILINTGIEMFFRYVLLKEKKPVYLITAIALFTINTFIVASPYFIDAVSNTPSGGYYIFWAILLMVFIYTFCDMLIHYKKINDPRVSRTVFIFSLFLIAAAGIQIIKDYNQFFLEFDSKISGINILHSLLFILWNIVIMGFANHYFTAKTIVFPVIKITAPKISKEFHLSERETEIIARLCLGYSNREIGEQLFISDLTVKTHVRNIYQKLGVKNRLELLDKVSLFKD
ncbi:MAG: helix-turn-helix transcriptional regulator [Brevinematales bacterium]|nr:helix-turn-helix transcriptional regulator [Brevinematales bacterium]